LSALQDLKLHLPHNYMYVNNIFKKKNPFLQRFPYVCFAFFCYSKPNRTRTQNGEKQIFQKSNAGPERGGGVRGSIPPPFRPKVLLKKGKYNALWEWNPSPVWKPTLMVEPFLWKIPGSATVTLRDIGLNLTLDIYFP
jgi:hypothetical protein